MGFVVRFLVDIFRVRGEVYRVCRIVKVVAWEYWVGLGGKLVFF